MYNKFLSYIIKDIRIGQNLTQKELGKKIDKSEISIRKYESGEVKIPFSVLFILFKMFDVDIVYLKIVLDEIKDIVKREKIMTWDEYTECLNLFNDDMAKIYKLNPYKNNLADDMTMEQVKQILNDGLQNYIENYILINADNILPYDVKMKDFTKLRAEIINFLDFNIKKMIDEYEK